MSNIYYEILILKLCSKTKIQKNVLKEKYIISRFQLLFLKHILKEEL